MQPAITDGCAREQEHERTFIHPDSVDRRAGVILRWVYDALDWLDRYWDDPELRTGFWRNG